ncbi:MAG: transposase domain-containing protein [bacterium]
MDIQSVITRTVTVAGGRYAPGHLGELTQLVPFDMVDQALAATGTIQSRLRDLPSRVVVYLLLAACLFPEVGPLRVFGPTTTGETTYTAGLLRSLRAGMRSVRPVVGH